MFAALYGLGAYAVFLGTFLYMVGFIGDFAVPKSIDNGPTGPVGLTIAIDCGLLAVFALQHSVMARPGFKRLWTRIVPRVVERSTYVLFASGALILLFWQWRPLPQPIWTVADPIPASVLQSTFWFGWLLVLVSTFLINHFELFGLRQVWASLRGRTLPPASFKTPYLYKYMRHPIYLGFVLASWAAPVMTVGHLIFAVAMTGYILIGIWFEERDLIAQFGERYRTYREHVGMFWPKSRKGPTLTPRREPLS